METNRNELAEKMELIGQVFEIDGMDELLAKLQPGMKMVKFNAVVIQISGKMMKANKRLADRILALEPGMDDQKVQELDDAEYAVKLKKLIIEDLLGFFASSPHSDGRK